MLALTHTTRTYAGAVEHVTKEHAQTLDRVHGHLTSFIKKNARTYVDLGSIFSMTVAKKKS